MRRGTALLTLLTALLLAPLAWGQILLTQTGALRTAGGAGVDGDYSMIISLYPTGTSLVALWSESHDNVSVDNGVFRVILGADEPLTAALLTETPAIWLGISVEGEPELPRARLGRVAFAAVADFADTAGGLAGPIDSLDCSGCIDASDLAPGAVGAAQIAAGAIQDYHVAFAYAGSATAGGPAELALDVSCDGCVDPEDLAFPAATLADVEALGPSLDDLGCQLGESPQMGPDGWICAAVKLGGLSFGKANGFELIDGLGWIWDGRERAAATFEDARDHCLSLGGRLPTVAELFRNRNNASGAVGQVWQGSWLWTGIARDPTVTMIGRWSNGTITVSTNSTKRNYRCVWPDQTTLDFTGDHCHGGCFALGDHHHVDMVNRPPMPLTAAIRECAAVGARVPDVWELESAVRAGLPNGTGGAVWTGDQYKGTNSGAPFVTLTWQGSNVSWFPPQKFGGANAYNGAWADTTTISTRCIGLASKSGLTAPVAGAFASAAHAAAADATDGPSFTYLEAVDSCRMAGGHVVDNVEALGLLVQGWANGSGAGIWTAEHHDLPMLTLHWTDTEPGFYPDKPFVGSGSGLGTKWYSELGAHRCIYYSTVEWTEPTADCKGGCFTAEAGASQTAIDKQDRTPATYFDALDHCRSLGARLPSTRDLEELVRLGAPNGGGVGVWTTSSHVSSNNGPPKLTVRWTGTTKGWTPVNDFTNGVIGYSSQWPGSPLPYRCVWTNEVF